MSLGDFWRGNFFGAIIETDGPLGKSKKLAKKVNFGLIKFGF
jgi:hypothetical protein